MNRPLQRFLGVLLGIFALIAPLPAADPSGLKTAPAVLREIPREIRLDGTVEAVQQATISAQTGGRVEAVLFDVDDYVENGAVVVRLRNAEQQARLAQTRANLKASEARLREAQEEYNRVKGIFDKQLTSESAMDKARAALNTAKAGYQATAADVEQAVEQLGYTEVRAPYSGIVTQRHVEVGETAQPGEPLLTGISLSRLRILVDVPQRLISAIREFRKARLLLPDGKVIDAAGLTVFPIADKSSNTFKLRLELPENLTGLFPGMFVKVAFQIGLKQELLIPIESVVYRGEVTGVYVIDENGGIHLRHIRLGHPTEQGYTVLAGLNPEEAVALDPIAAGIRLKQRKQD
ncbi:MAG: efflux RND transporter periplasmic adaptor subunit [Gammaproteobacteria bacterium]|nr:efflux RND transporter periplasmic adaptor subunit [Gammaproteobacteria bacterium]HXK56782.1 efflux RND transporter periplasmic adaptor subunit [Gammaproteobacteria bacterium]